jgi:hypothetical protein
MYRMNDPTRPLFRHLVIAWLATYAVASIILTGSIGYGLLNDIKWQGKERRVQRGVLMVAKTLLPNCLM